MKDMFPSIQKTLKLLNYDSDVLLQRSWSSGARSVTG